MIVFCPARWPLARRARNALPQSAVCTPAFLGSPKAAAAMAKGLLSEDLPDLPDDRAALLPSLAPEQSASVRAMAAAALLRLQDSSDSEPVSQKQRAAEVQAQQVLHDMLGCSLDAERLAASAVLRDLPQLTRFKAQIPALLADHLPAVRQRTLQAIATQASNESYPDTGQLGKQALYPYLLKALQNPLTEVPAQAALVSMGERAIAPLRRCTQHPSLSEAAKQRCWTVLAQLDCDRARQLLVEHVTQTSGQIRQHLLRLLVEQPNGKGRIALTDALAGPRGIMLLVKEEIWLQGHLYAALVDLHPQQFNQPDKPQARQLRQALIAQQRDGGERILLLLQLFSPQAKLQEVTWDLRDRATIPRGLRRLQNMLPAELCPVVLAIFDAQPVFRKLAAMAAATPPEGSPWFIYHPLAPAQRLRVLLSLQPGLESESLAAAYRLASALGLALTHQQVLWGLDHESEKVQTAVNQYLERMTGSVLQHLRQVNAC